MSKRKLVRRPITRRRHSKMISRRGNASQPRKPCTRRRDTTKCSEEADTKENLRPTGRRPRLGWYIYSGATYTCASAVEVSKNGSQDSGAITCSWCRCGGGRRTPGSARSELHQNSADDARRHFAFSAFVFRSNFYIILIALRDHDGQRPTAAGCGECSSCARRGDC